MHSFSLPYMPNSAQHYAGLIANTDGFIWFHQGDSEPSVEWFSAFPHQQFEYWGNDHCRIVDEDGHSLEHHGSFIELLRSSLPVTPRTDMANIPFIEGLAGHLNYDLGLELLNVASKFNISTHAQAVVGHYSWSCVVDHSEQSVKVYLGQAVGEKTRMAVERFILAASQLEKPDINRQSIDGPWQCSMSETQYQEAFEQIKHYIIEGDIYQANLTRQWQTQSTLPAWALYLQLCSAMPAPFSVFHHTRQQTLLSVSPERFIQVDGERIFTQPIKGTRPRNENPVIDQKMRNELANSSKDKAENLMIVDLLRNDIAKNALPGSVSVDQLYELQSFKNVHHLVSSISAKRKPDAHPLDVLWDAFPGGSITGAPKRRAMQVIDELETVARGSYCGTAFFMRSDGYLDSNILIRTITKTGSTLLCSGGGGIVYDSELSAEYAESELKVRRLLDALL